MDVQSLSAIKKAKAALEAKMDTISDSVAVELDKGNDRLDNSLAKFDETVGSMPSGVPAPRLASIIAVSNNEGIAVTYKAVSESKTSVDSQTMAVTKGVMVRHSTTGFPTTPDEGTLSFIDEDLFTVGTNGAKTAKSKTTVVAGLTTGNKYYFTAFPYSTQNVYNEAMGTTQCTTCSWTGTKGTLTVIVTANEIDELPLDTYTVTLRSSAGVDTVKKMNGVGRVQFSSIETDVYTVIFSDVNPYKHIDNVTIDVLAGQNNEVSVVYKLAPTLEEMSWSNINAIAEAGLAATILSVGDTKEITVNGETLTMEIIGFNHDDLTDGGKAGITFATKHLMTSTREMNSNASNASGWTGSGMYAWLTTTCYNGLPSDLKNYIKLVKKKTSIGLSNYTIETNNMKIFLLSGDEVNSDRSYAFSGEGDKYPRFTTKDSRVKKLSNGTSNAAVGWWLRSPYKNSNSSFCGVMYDGGTYYDRASSKEGVCFGFCI